MVNVGKYTSTMDDLGMNMETFSRFRQIMNLPSATRDQPS